MTRENKAGLTVAGVFLTLATTVGVLKWREVPGRPSPAMSVPPVAATEPESPKAKADEQARAEAAEKAKADEKRKAEQAKAAEKTKAEERAKAEKAMAAAKERAERTSETTARIMAWSREWDLRLAARHHA